MKWVVNTIALNIEILKPCNIVTTEVSEASNSGAS
jgi:hypothetical protein